MLSRKARLVIVANAINAALAVVAVFDARLRLANVVSLAATLGMGAMVVLEHTAAKPPRHRYTVVFALLAVVAAALDLATGLRRNVDYVGFAGALVAAAVSVLARPRPKV